MYSNYPKITAITGSPYIQQSSEIFNGLRRLNTVKSADMDFVSVLTV